MAKVGTEIGYRSYQRIRNLGDAFTPYVLTHLTGLRPVIVSHDVPHLLAIGSITFMASEHSRLWGTGMLNADTHLPPVAPEKIFALRGKRSVETMRAKGINVADVPLGDPGIFASEVMASRVKEPEIRYRAAIIPHHNSYAHPFFQRLHDSKEFVVVEIMTSTLEPLEQILQSEVVISQSLHGLIFAESLGKPAVWIAHQNNAHWNFKFDDWYSTTSNPQTEPLPLNGDIEEIIGRAERSFSTIDKAALADALPRTAVTKNLSTFPLDFERCRDLEPVTVTIPTLFGGRIFRSKEDLSEQSPVAGRNVYDCWSAFFRGWSERVYLCVNPADEAIPVTQSQLRWICAMMDRDLNPDFAYIVDRQSICGLDVEIVEIGYGVAIAKGKTVLGGAVLMRPQFDGLRDNFITFVV